MSAGVSTALKSLVIVGGAVCLAAVAGIGEPLLQRPFRSPDANQQLLDARDAAAFFSARNQITIRVPRAMSVDELVVLYRLEQVRGYLPKSVQAGELITVPLTPGKEVSNVPR